MDESCVPPETRSLAPELAPIAATHGLALGGGTACALRLGHRTSADLDLFALGSLDTSAVLGGLEPLGERRLRGISGTELAAVVRGIEVSVTALGREPLAPPEEWAGLAVLSVADLAELKVDAAVRRGMARALCDLHQLCLAGEDLERAIRASPVDLIPALKALTDGERFGAQPALDLRIEWNIEAAVAYFEAEARRLIT